MSDVGLLLILLTVLVAIGIPVAYAMGLVSLFMLVAVQGLPLTVLAQRMAAALDSFPILAIPFFILVGNLMNTGGVADRIFRFALTLVGHIRGGLAHVNVVNSMIFAGMTGSAMADASGIGLLEIKAMVDEDYPPDFSAALSAVTSTVGPIIPPSVPFVVYGVLGEVSVGRLFAGGLLPGIAMGLGFMVTVHILAVRRNYPAYSGRAPVRLMGKAFIDACPPFVTVAVLMGGIMFGVFTPTEAAAVAALYALFLGRYLYRELSWRQVWEVFLLSGKQSGILFAVIASAAMVAWLVTLYQIPDLFATAVSQFTSSPVVVLLIINLFLLIVGCFVDIISGMIITVPILLPLAQRFGIDPVHFGIIVVLNLMIGGITPPVAMLTYVVSTFSRVPFERVVRASLPFMIPLLTVLALVTYLPDVVLFVPRLIFG